MLSKAKESRETTIIREKIRMKKRDRKVYVQEMEGILTANREKRNALRIGNDCLRFMTQRQENLSQGINGRIFSERSREERLPMLKQTLQNSINTNDMRLFRFGKRLLKQDYLKEKRKRQEFETKEDLQRAIEDRDWAQQDFEDRSYNYLHKQAMVEDYKSRDVAAKTIALRLTKMLEALNMSLNAMPARIADLEHTLEERQRELEDFHDLKQGALRFLEIEQKQLDPLNEELAMVTAHFEKLIAIEKNELDDRRKKSSLSKFLSEREMHAFNFTGSSNITETKIKARNSALVNARDTLMQIMDAMLITDLKNVVDSIVDQEEVTYLLQKEKKSREQKKNKLEAQLQALRANNAFLQYNGVTQASAQSALDNALKQESDEQHRYSSLETTLSQRDHLLSELQATMHALFEKLRPVKLDMPDNLYQGELIGDAKRFIKKLSKMIKLVENYTVPVGHVKPLMLHVYQQRRVPPDSVRVATRDAGQQTMGMGIEAYEADTPGYISREMLKSRAEEAVAGRKNKHA